MTRKSVEDTAPTQARKREPHPESLAATSRAAGDLVSWLHGVLDGFDTLRAADRSEPPDPIPAWWDGYVDDSAWADLGGKRRTPPNHDDRVHWANRKVRDAIGGLLSKWDVLTEPIPIHESERHAFEACRQSLRNLDGMLTGAHYGVRLRHMVIPARWHLDEVTESDTEPLKTARTEWKREVHRWNLGEQDVLDLLNRLTGPRYLPAPTDLPRAIDEFIRSMSEFAKWRFIQTLNRPQPCKPGTDAERDMLDRLERQHEHEMDARDAIADVGPKLAALLVQNGRDATAIYKIIHFIVEGGGPDNAFRDWPDVKAQLRQIRCGLLGSSAGPTHAYLSAAGSIVDTYLAGLTDDPEMVTSSGSTLDQLVKLELGPLRTRAEESLSEPIRARMRPIFDELDKAAWDLAEALRGSTRSEIISGRKLRRGGWTEPMERLRTVAERARWCAFGENRQQATDAGGEREAPVDPLDWVTIAAAEKATGINRGTIQRAAEAGEIVDNGKKKRERRLRAGSVLAWAVERAGTGELTESPQEVARKLREVGL